MNRSLVAHGKHTETGFSLLELMVVIVIVAMLFTFTALSIRSDSPEDLIKQEALRFNRLLQLLMEESILKGEDYGIEFGPTEYRFLQLDEENGWTPIEKDKLYRLRELPQEMELELAVEQTDIVIANSAGGLGEEKIKPQVFILSSGEITPEFELQFTIPTVTSRYIVRGSFDGKHVAELAQ